MSWNWKKREFGAKLIRPDGNFIFVKATATDQAPPSLRLANQPRRKSVAELRSWPERAPFESSNEELQPIFTVRGLAIGVTMAASMFALTVLGADKLPQSERSAPQIAKDSASSQQGMTADTRSGMEALIVMTGAELLSKDRMEYTRPVVAVSRNVVREAARLKR